MKASQLISVLAEIIGDHGDLDVNHQNGSGGQNGILPVVGVTVEWSAIGRGSHILLRNLGRRPLTS